MNIVDPNFLTASPPFIDSIETRSRLDLFETVYKFLTI